MALCSGHCFPTSDYLLEFLFKYRLSNRPPLSSEPPPPPVACTQHRDDSKCTSSGEDCCACDASIGQTECGWEEPATCSDGFVPRITAGSDGGMHSEAPNMRKVSVTVRNSNDQLARCKIYRCLASPFNDV